MNGYELQAKWRETNEAARFTPYETSLYYFLCGELNLNFWRDGFLIPNGVICETLSMSEPTLIRSRKRLQDFELLFFEAAQGSKEGVKYWLITDPNKIEMAKKNDEKSLLITSIQTECTRWFTEDFYKPTTKTKYFFDRGKDAKNLKLLLEKVYDSLPEFGKEPDAESMVLFFQAVVLAAYQKDDWLKKNFTIPNINSQFNPIILLLATNNGNNRYRYEEQLSKLAVV